MPHVFFETNWLHDCAAPAHHKVPDAVRLLERAQRVLRGRTTLTISGDLSEEGLHSAGSRGGLELS
ncbi:hypothetical protein SBA4_2040006 [Candidatus Sulfopaludibacter sp. SbA4]|nr:hypothetical protein SBA4_2040006 [Candidatus Sulfopaludibacter sp. SbA4]